MHERQIKIRKGTKKMILDSSKSLIIEPRLKTSLKMLYADRCGHLLVTLGHANKDREVCDPKLRFFVDVLYG